MTILFPTETDRSEFESQKRVTSTRSDVSYLNKQHCAALRRLSLSQQNDYRLPPAESVILNGRETDVKTLLDHAPACLFGVSTQQGKTNMNPWWDMDDLVDQLLAAKEIARWSSKCAYIMTGVEQNVITALSNGGATKAREVASHSQVFVRWRAKDVRRTMGMLSLQGDLRTTRHSNARLLMACSIIRVTSKPSVGFSTPNFLR